MLRIPGSAFNIYKVPAHTNNVVSIVVATALCAGTLYMLNALPGILNMEAPYNVLTTGLVPVSYTHLDVYKRQVYTIPKEEVETIEFTGSWNIGWW